MGKACGAYGCAKLACINCRPFVELAGGRGRHDPSERRSPDTLTIGEEVPTTCDNRGLRVHEGYQVLLDTVSRASTGIVEVRHRWWIMMATRERERRGTRRFLICLVGLCGGARRLRVLQGAPCLENGDGRFFFEEALPAPSSQRTHSPRKLPLINLFRSIVRL